MSDERLGFEDQLGVDEDFVMPPDVEPAISDMLPKGYLSISQTTQLLQCAWRYFLTTIMMVATKKPARLFRGTCIHYGVEHLLTLKMQTGRLPKVDEALDAFSTAFEKEKETVEDWEGQQPGQIKDLGSQLTKMYFAEVAPTATPIAVEKSFCTVIKSADGKVRLPIVGRIDSVQVMLDDPKRYDPEQAANLPKHMRRIHDLKVVTNKFPEGKVANSLQFMTYAAAEGIPTVQADQLVIGRAKVPRPRYEAQSAVITSANANHAVSVLTDAATMIAKGHFPKTDPGNWWCSKKWCPVWHECRGKGEQ
jgi:hypothetical protein